MRKREAGFSLFELLITMAIIGFVLAAGSEMFVNLLRGYKQQSRIAETNIEGIIGLEMLRRDIESAGYGLPWSIPGTTYAEAINATAANYNDSNSNPPRAFLCGNNITGDSDLVGGADYIVIKALNLPRNAACTKWTYLLSTGATTTWDPDSEDLGSSDRGIVLSPGTLTGSSRVLVGPIGDLSNGTVPSLLSGASAFSSSTETRLVYGVDSDTNLRMPFNRADYRVRKDNITIPGRCAQGTGVLVKSIVNQSNGGFNGNSLPLLDCVADMQVVTYLDTNADGAADTYSPGLALANAQAVRDQLKEVHVYILAHEGQRDTSYIHPTDETNPNKIWVGPGSEPLGRNFNLAANITNWRNYRWKVYTLVVRPNNLR